MNTILVQEYYFLMEVKIKTAHTYMKVVINKQG